MEIGKFVNGVDKTLQVERKTSVLQFAVFGVDASGVADFFTSQLQVWNNKGKLIPPTSLATLVVMNADRYPIMEGVDNAHEVYNLVVNVDISQEGFLSPTIYVKLDNQCTNDVTLSALVGKDQTAVFVNNYNSMLITSPQLLPKNSLCMFTMDKVQMVQKNHDVMSISEILTHSQCLKENLFKELHPVWYNVAKTQVEEDAVYSSLAGSFALGYGGVTAGGVVLYTGDNDIMLYPDVLGGTACPVYYCQKNMTQIASQVYGALVEAGQTNNVDSNEFAAAVAAVGESAEQQGLDTTRTRFLAQRTVQYLPSVITGRRLGVSNLNLSQMQSIANLNLLVGLSN